jgi:hypothetical protein
MCHTEQVKANVSFFFFQVNSKQLKLLYDRNLNTFLIAMRWFNSRFHDNSSPNDPWLELKNVNATMNIIQQNGGESSEGLGLTSHTRGSIV